MKKAKSITYFFLLLFFGMVPFSCKKKDIIKSGDPVAQEPNDF